MKPKQAKPRADARGGAKPLKRKAKEMTPKSAVLKLEEARQLSIKQSQFHIPDYDFVKMSMREEVPEMEFMSLEKPAAMLGPDIFAYKVGIQGLFQYE